jgi:hypothetical protein
MPERINQNMVKLPQKNQMYNMTHKIFTSCHTKKQTTNVRRFQEIIESFFQSFKGQLLTNSKCPFKSPKYEDVKNVAIWHLRIALWTYFNLIIIQFYQWFSTKVSRKPQELTPISKLVVYFLVNCN